MPIVFSNKLWLLLLIAVVPAAIAWYNYLRSPGVPRLTKAVTGLRTVTLICLMLALAGAHWVAKRPGVDVFVAVDVSQSISPENTDLAVQVIKDLASVAGKHDRVGVVAFGGEAYADQPLGRDLTNLRGIESAPPKSETDVAAALSLVQAMAEPNRNSRLLLLSDGMVTQGNADALADRFREIHIPIDALPLGSAPTAEVSVEQVTAPNRVAQEQPFRVRVVAASTFSGPARLRLFRNDALISDEEISLDPGRNLYDFTGLRAEPGVYTFTARIEAERDELAQNNASYAAVVVEGPNRMLLVTENKSASTALVAALQQQGVRLDVSNAASLPANATELSAYASLILHDVPALRFSQTQLEQVETYVRDLGGGLLVIGGHNSYGLGGYFKTPLEDALPVTMDAPQTLVMPSLALVLVIDHSGSMADHEGTGTKLELAKEAALGVVDVITEQDLFGVLSFDNENEWTVPLQPAANREEFAERISKLAAGGGTDLGPAMRQALAVLRNSQAMVKHVIVLTDGHSVEYDFDSVVRDYRAHSITVSTVAVGQGADVELLQGIAKQGNGRFHYTKDASAIPRIFANEAFVVSRPLAVESTVQPWIGQEASFLSGPSLDGFPVLDGYVLTTPKANATVHLQTVSEDALLASWRYGLGRAVAFTSGVTDSWAKEWLSWDGFAPFWAQLARWTMRSQSESSLQPYFEVDGGRGSLIVDAIDESGGFVNFLDLQAEVVSPDRSRATIPLKQTSPGRYQADFAAGTQGAWLATVAATNDPAYAEPALAGAVLPYSSEYSLMEIETGLLARLSQRTNGTMLAANALPSRSRLRTLFNHPYPSTVSIPLWPALLLAAFLLFLLDIAMRYLPPATLQRIEGIFRRVPILGRLFVEPASTGIPGTDIPPTDLSQTAEGQHETPQPQRLEDLVRSKQGESEEAPQHGEVDIATARSAARYLAERRRVAENRKEPPTGGSDQDD